MGGTAKNAASLANAQPTQKHRTASTNLANSTSYGGQSASSAEDVEVDYGDGDGHGHAEAVAVAIEPVTDPEQSWAAEPTMDNSGKKQSNYGSAVFQDAQGGEEGSDDGDDSDYSSSSSSSSGSSSDNGNGSGNGLSEAEEEVKNSRNQRWHDEESPNEKTALRHKRKRRSRSSKKRRGGMDVDEDEEEDAAPIKPRRNCCHSFFIIVQIAAVLANLCMITLEVVPAIYVLNSGKPEKLQILDLVLRSYFTFFSLLFLVAELEWFNSSLSNWIIKGFLYSFLGVVAKEQHLAMLANGTLVVKQNTKAYWNGVWAALFVQVSSWWLIGIGILYFLMGIFFLRELRNRFREQYQTRLREYKEATKRR